MANTTIIPTLLAQNATATEMIGVVFQALTTPVGMIAAVLFTVLLSIIFLHRNGAYIGGTLVLILISMMSQENKYFDNTLVTPLHQLRDVSRPLSVLILAAMSGNLLLAPQGIRSRALSFFMLAFFLFQTFYLLRLGLRGEYARAGLGWITDLLMLIAFAWGFAKRLERDRDLERYVNMFGIASLGFIALNMVQLGLGYGQAIANGRFAGISGNPQLAGYVSAIFILFNTHIFARSPFGSPSRWIFGIAIGVLAILILWAGSRMSALSAAAGLVAYFRFRLGSATLLAAVGGLSLALVATIFGDSLLGLDRFIYGDNTRRDVWLGLLEEFYSAPLLGAMGSRSDGAVSANESSYLTTLALMGISGAIPLAIFVSSIFVLAARMLWIRRRGVVRPLQADLVFASIAIILVGSIFEGFFLGIISLPVIFIYSTGALGAFLIERDANPLTAEDDDDMAGFDGEEYGEGYGEGYGEDLGSLDPEPLATESDLSTSDETHESLGRARRE